MKRLDTDTVRHAEEPLAVKALGAAFALAGGAVLVCLALGVDWDAAWRIAAVIGAACLVVAGVGAFRRVLDYAIEISEQVTNYDIDGDGVVGGETVRIVPVYQSRSMNLSGSASSVAEDDLRFMISKLDVERQSGWTQREWLGERLPSGREIVSVDVGPYAAFIEMLERIGAVVDRDERRKGRLVKSNIEIMNELGL